MTLRLLAVLVACYFLGCIVAAYYVTKIRHGADIRASGSGNAGARNTARVYGPVDAILTFLVDAAKGSVAVLIGTQVTGLEWAGAAALTAAIVGHIWPAQLGFHGGKGAATGLGGVVVIDPLASLTLLVSGAVLFAFTRNFSASGLTVIALSSPMLALYGHGAPTIAVVAVASALCLIVQHPLVDAPRQPRPAAHRPDEG
jgi:glycerol-3-phosphate acyltransferase PlsY